MRQIAFIAALIYVFTALPAYAGEKEKFTEYYHTAKNDVSSLNSISTEIERAKPTKGLSPAKCKKLKEGLLEIRDDVSAILTYSKAAGEINEKYLLYIDKMLIGLSLSENYYGNKDKQTYAEMKKAINEAKIIKSEADEVWQAKIVKYGLK